MKTHQIESGLKAISVGEEDLSPEEEMELEVTPKIVTTTTETVSVEETVSTEAGVEEPEANEEVSVRCKEEVEEEEGVVIPVSDATHDDITEPEPAPVKNEADDCALDPRTLTENELAPDPRASAEDDCAPDPRALREDDCITEPRPSAAARVKASEAVHKAVLKRQGCPQVGDFAKAFGIQANFIQLGVMPEILEPADSSSMRHGLAVDLLELSLDYGVEPHRLVAYLGQFVPKSRDQEGTGSRSRDQEDTGHRSRDHENTEMSCDQEGTLRSRDQKAKKISCEEDNSAEVVARVMSRLAKVRIQASRFRARHAQHPTYLENYLLTIFDPFS